MSSGERIGHEWLHLVQSHEAAHLLDHLSAVFQLSAAEGVFSFLAPALSPRDRIAHAQSALRMQCVFEGYECRTIPNEVLRGCAWSLSHELKARSEIVAMMCAGKGEIAGGGTSGLSECGRISVGRGRTDGS